MTITAKSIREERANVISNMNAITTLVSQENRSMTAEEMENFDKANQAQKDLLQKAETIERCESVPQIEERRETRKVESFRANNPNHITEETRDLALKAWCLQGMPGSTLPEEFRRAGEQVGLNPYVKDLTIRLNNRPPRNLKEAYDAEKRTALSTTGANGGYTISQFPVQRIETALLQYSNMRELAEVVRTDKGGPFPYAKSIDATNIGEIIGENTQVDEAEPTFTQTVLNDFTYSSKMVLVSRQMLNDSAFDLTGWLADRLGERLGRKQQADFTTGAGSTLPRGFMIDAVNGKTSTSTGAAPTWQEVLALIHSVDPAYRRLPGVGLMMNDTTWGIYQGIADSQNRPLWIPSLVGGEADRFAGYPVYINQSMAAHTTGLKPVAFGAFSKYVIRDVGDITIMKLVERFADYNQVALLAFMRTDAALFFNTGYLPIKYMTLS